MATTTTTTNQRTQSLKLKQGGKQFQTWHESFPGAAAQSIVSLMPSLYYWGVFVFVFVPVFVFKCQRSFKPGKSLSLAINIQMFKYTNVKKV